MALITVDDVQAATQQTYTDTALAQVQFFIDGVSSLIENFCYPVVIPDPTPGAVKLIAVSEVRRYINTEPGVGQERIDNLSESFEAGGATMALAPGSEKGLKQWKRTQRKTLTTVRMVSPSQWDEIPPTTPTDLAVSSVDSTTISLTWTAATDDRCFVGYRVYEGTVLVADTYYTCATIRGLLPSTSHTYAVLAYDGVGNVSPLTTPVTGVTTA